ncbi:MAG: peptide chain release factor N(5)-glutamine methyltransferase [Actinomycetota bacterium]
MLASGRVEIGPREADWVLEAARSRASSQGEVERIALELAERRAEGEPLQYVLETAAFRHLELSVGPGVLVPRPETEVLVERALDRLPQGGMVVDVGTGSGAIALAIKQERPDARVWATDDSTDALRYARVNREQLGLDVEILLGGLLEPLPGSLRGGFDLVVSNPPYVSESESHLVAPDVLGHEPDHAVFGGGGDGLSIVTTLVSQALPWLRPEGWLVCEIGHGQSVPVVELFESAGFIDSGVHEDLAGWDRIVEGRKPDQ